MTTRRRPRTFSQTFINTGPPPGVYSDGLGGNGLSLRVHSSGAANFTQRLRLANGKYTNIGLGPIWQITLDDARDQARKNRALAASGQVINTRVTVADAMTRLNRPASWTRPIEIHLAPLLSRPIAAVTTAEVIAALEPTWIKNPPSAKRARQQVAHVFAWAIAQGLRTDNPADKSITAGLPTVTHKAEHFEAIPAADLPHFFKQAAQVATSHQAIDCLTWQALTAARPIEAIKARWDQIDLAARTWTIAAEDYKTGQVHTIPLSTPALAILKRMEGNDPIFIFGRGKSKPPAKNTTRTLMAKVHDSATPHGLRSSFRSWCMENHIGRDLAETALGHVIPGVEGAYARSRMIDQRRPLMEQWAHRLSA